MALNFGDDDKEIEAAHNAGFSAGRSQGYSAGYNAGKDAGVAIGRAEGAAAERERIKTIMALPLAKERPNEAAHIALSTSVSVHDAHEAIKGMMIGAKASADASWDAVIGKLNRERGFGGRNDR